MGNTDSKQKLGEKVTAARKKFQEDSQIYSEKSNAINSKSSKLSQYMMKSIEKTFKSCSAFLEPTLLTAWYSNPAKCETIVLDACNKVLNAPIIKKEWDWFQQYVFPSSIWMFKSIKYPNKYMYEQLLDVAELYSKNIMSSMDSIYNSLQYQNGWKELMNIESKTFISRQDDKKVGLFKDKALIDVLETKTEQDDEVQAFLDSNWCINSLISTANTLNNEFQNHIKTVMGHYGEFKPGPLKKIQRCQSKMENDYSDAAFPKCAKLLDIIRCSVTFNTVEQLINGYNGLIKHIKSNNHTVEVARIKNGFLDKNEGGYKDVKINVVYHSPVTNNSMVCEVQLLLVNYLWEKKKIHKLYNVMRQKEYFKMVVAEEIKNEQKEKDYPQLKLVPTFNFHENIKKPLDADVLFKCSIDSELDLLGVRGNDWFGCMELNTKKVIFEQNVPDVGMGHNHHWIKRNNKKYLTIQSDRNIIKMYKVNNHTFEEDKTMAIKVADSSEINIIEFDKHYENAFVIVDKKVLEQRAMDDIDNVMMRVELKEEISDIALKQLCLSDNGEFCVIAGGMRKKYFYLIDLKKESSDKLISGNLNTTNAPCFINGESKYVMVGDTKGKIEIWDIRTKTVFKVMDECKGIITCAMSTNNILAVALQDKTITAKSTMKLWDVRNWNMFYSNTFEMEPYSLHLTSDGKYLTIGGDGGEQCLVWKIE